MSDEADPVDADELLHRAARVGLGSRPVARQLSIALWASFLGAIPMLLTWLVLLPEDTAAGLGVEAVSIGFFLCWLAALIPVGIALLLSERATARAAALAETPGHEHSR